MELAMLADLESLDPVELRDVISSCGSFLNVREDMVYFVHQSAKEFLITSAANTIFPLGIRRKHASISKASIKALSQGLRWDMYNLQEPGIYRTIFNSKSRSSGTYSIFVYLLGRSFCRRIFFCEGAVPRRYKRTGLNIPILEREVLILAVSFKSNRKYTDRNFFYVKAPLT